MISDSIQKALSMGANPDDIVTEIANQNPAKAASFQQARQMGANSQQILDEIQKQNQGQSGAPLTQPKSGIQKVADTLYSPIVSAGKDILGIGGKDNLNSPMGEIFKSTIGSEGAAGVGQQLAKGIFRGSTQGGVNEMNSATDSLIQSAHNLNILAQKTQDPQKKAGLLKAAKDTITNASNVHGQSIKSQEDYGFSAPKLAASTANAGLTALGAGESELGTGIKTQQTLAKAGLFQSINAGSKTAKAVALGSRAFESAVTAAGFKVANNVSNDNPTAKGVAGAAAFGAAIPVVASTVSAAIDGIGKGLQSLGNKIQISKIRPSVTDVSDGFKIENVNKYDVGGSLQDSLTKTNAKLNDLGKQLADELKSSNKTIDLNKIYQDTSNALSGTGEEHFGELGNIDNQLVKLKGEIARVGGNASLPKAQIVKQAAGTKGAWVFGNPDPEARASEIVYNTFYNKLKTAIESSLPEGVAKKLNSQMSDLIPIRNAILRRLPVEERANAVSLTDFIGLLHGISDPKALMFTGANKVLKSGKFGSMLTKTGEAIGNRAPSSMGIVRKITGR